MVSVGKMHSTLRKHGNSQLGETASPTKKRFFKGGSRAKKNAKGLGLKKHPFLYILPCKNIAHTVFLAGLIWKLEVRKVKKELLFGPCSSLSLQKHCKYQRLFFYRA